MNDASLLRLAAVFSFLSPLAILAGIPFAASLGGVGGPGPIDYGDGALLLRLAELGEAPVRVDLFALLGPVFALPAAFGWYALLRSKGRLVQLGVGLWLIGMVFIVMQDALQLAFTATLPAAYAAADASTRAAIAAVGGGLGYAIDVLAFTGHLPNGLGFLLLSLLMWRSVVPQWIAGLGLASATLSLGAGVLSFAFPVIAWFGIGVPIGIFLLLVCIAGLGVVMLREAKRQAAQANEGRGSSDYSAAPGSASLP
jgi:hypothetical protein